MEIKLEKIFKILRVHPVLYSGCAVSLLLFAFFAILQTINSSIIKLDTQWLIVSGLPILISLIIGGYIANFKGFGIELESKLKAPVMTMNLRATDVISSLRGDDKDSIGRLANFTNDKIEKTKRLSFITGKTNYYGSHAVMEYLQTLRNVEFLEVKKENGEFVCLVPVGEFKKKYHGNNHNLNDKFDLNEIEHFIFSVENMNTKTKYKSACVDTTVKQDDSLIDVLLRLRKNNKPSAVVIDEDGGFVGLITANDIERRIADDVIYSRQNLTNR